MSTNESKQKSSKVQPDSREQDNSTQAQRRPDNRKPLPFDAGGAEEVVETTDPQKPPIEMDF